MVELLEQFVSFNEITEQSKLAIKWPLYKKWLQTLAKSSETYETCSNFEINGLQASLDDLDTVFAGNIYQVSECLHNNQHITNDFHCRLSLTTWWKRKSKLIWRTMALYASRSTQMRSSENY